MRKLLAVWVAAGCGSAPPSPALSAPANAAVIENEVPRATYLVVPAELGDEGVLGRLRHRVVLRRWVSAQLRRDDPETVLAAPHAELGDAILPVIDEMPRQLRVVIEDDAARYAVWVARAHTGQTVLAPTRLRQRKAAPTIGVFVEPGAIVLLLEDRGDTRKIRVVDDELAIEGRVARALVGNVWVVPPGTTDTHHMKHGEARSWSMPEDSRYVRIAPNTIVRAVRAHDGAALATVNADEIVGVRHATRDGWTEVELLRPHLRVRGFVPERSILGAGEAVGFGSIGTSAYGTGVSLRHDLPAGTCLYDRADGEVIGVQLAAGQRRGSPIVDGWASVTVRTPWALARMYVKNVAADPTSPPVWDVCARSVSGR